MRSFWLRKWECLWRMFGIANAVRCLQSDDMHIPWSLWYGKVNVTAESASRVGASDLLDHGGMRQCKWDFQTYPVETFSPAAQPERKNGSHRSRDIRVNETTSHSFIELMMPAPAATATCWMSQNLKHKITKKPGCPPDVIRITI